MPWQSAELIIGDVELAGSMQFKNVAIVAGKHGKVVAQQPTWISDTQLLFICDAANWLNPWIYDIHTSARPILPEPLAEEFGEPMWLLGGSSYAFLDADLSIWSTVKNGLAALYLLRLSTAQLTQIPGDFVEILRVRRIDQNSVVFIAKTGLQPDFLVKLTIGSNAQPTFTVLKYSLLPSKSVSTAFFSIGKPLNLENDNKGPIHAIFYPPKNPNCIGPVAELPPCVIYIHGGPTSRQKAGFDWIHQYYTSRGWAWCATEEPFRDDHLSICKAGCQLRGIHRIRKEIHVRNSDIPPIRP